MMEKASVLLNKGNAELLSCLEDGLIVLASAGGSHVFDAGPCRAVNVVGEGEL